MIRWGIIGCGNVCEVKSGPAFQKCTDSQLVTVMRRDADKAKDFALRHGVPRWTTDAASVIKDPEVDAVYIATPVGSHLEHALAVAAAGKPCLVEKPMARNKVECREMMAAFERARQPLFVAYYRRCLPWFVHARQVIASGRLGIITSVNVVHTMPAQRRQAASSPWRLSAEESGGGLFMDLAAHTLDLLDYFLGPIAEVHGIAANRAAATSVEDCVALCFRFESGIIGVGNWDFAADSSNDIIQINGSEGRLTTSLSGRSVRVESSDENADVFEVPSPPHVHQPLVQTIVDELKGRGTCPSSGASAARTAAVMDAALDSYYGGRQDAFWSREDSWPGRRRT